MSRLPKISVVVPNLNGGPDLARCLKGLVSQGYPSLELLVVDGGSVDGSLEIIEGFRDHIAWRVSEPDRGQTDALNKGLARATGEVLGWLNADDELLPGALAEVGGIFARDPAADVVAGAGEIRFAESRRRGYVEHPGPATLDLLPAWNGIVQQSCFWRPNAVGRDPLLDPSCEYAMDVELWCRLKSREARWVFTDRILARFTLSPRSKSATGGERIAAELERIYRDYSGERVPLSFWYRHLRYPFERLLGRDRGLLRLAALRALQLLWIAAFSPFYGFRRVRRMSWPE